MKTLINILSLTLTPIASIFAVNTVFKADIELNILNWGIMMILLCAYDIFSIGLISLKKNF